MTRPIDKRTRSNGAWRIFRWPLLIAIASIVGLVSALVGDGAFDVASWLLLGAIVVAMVTMLARRS